MIFFGYKILVFSPSWRWPGGGEATRPTTSVEEGEQRKIFAVD